VVDAALVLGLVAGGTPAASALSAVVLYRLVSLVGVVAAGGLVHGTRCRCEAGFTIASAASSLTPSFGYRLAGTAGLRLAVAR